MLSKYTLFCRILELGSFTKAAQELCYSQSAVSQTVQNLEKDIGTTLIERKKEGITLTADGKQYYPYLRAICMAEKSLAQKQKEMRGLKDSIITIGTFTSVSRNLLLPYMRRFKELNPEVQYILKQGDYANIPAWIMDGTVDFGFINSETATGTHYQPLYVDHLLAVLPLHHPLTKKRKVHMQDLARQPFILLDEGMDNVTLAAFNKQSISPRLAYKVYDDYTILEMVRQGFGVSALYEKMLEGYEHHTCVLPIVEQPHRTISLAWKNWDTMPYAARKFAEFILQEHTSVK